MRYWVAGVPMLILAAMACGTTVAPQPVATVTPEPIATALSDVSWSTEDECVEEVRKTVSPELLSDTVYITNVMTNLTLELLLACRRHVLHQQYPENVREILSMLELTKKVTIYLHPPY